MNKHIHLVSFLIHSPINHTILTWADENDDRIETLGDIHRWQQLAQTLERGMFDGIFFADTPGVFDRYRNRADEAIRYGVCWPTHDPVVLLSALAAATRHIGLAATVSTGPTHPYSLVRQLSTLDYLSQGRIGWNIVTGHLRGEHRAFGLAELPHDERYERAEEYMEVCYALWDSVAGDAILADKTSGTFADPERVSMLHYKGKYFDCETVGPVWPSPQRRPVLFQAGSSGRGQQFAFKHADVVFAVQTTMDGMKKFMADFRAAGATDNGGTAPPVSFGIQPILGGTEEEARQHLRDLEERIPIEAALTRISGTLGVDFSEYELDRPLQEIQTQASQGLMKAMAAGFGDRPFTLREAAIRYGLAIGIPQLVGTPEQVADQMETIWRETGCHAFNVTPTIMSSSVEAFVDQVVPILQKKGIYRTEYEGRTFRENLKLP
jgi:FMN-dependent oxidoreductase (nitrilotriacetate monooxygenase family)